jgi:hypothetical protein
MNLPNINRINPHFRRSLQPEIDTDNIQHHNRRTKKQNDGNQYFKHWFHKDRTSDSNLFCRNQFPTDSTICSPNPKIKSPSKAKRIGISLESFTSFKFTKKQSVSRVTFMTNTTTSAYSLLRSPNLFNTRFFRPTHFSLPVLREISDGNHQPDDHGKPDSRDDEPKQRFYKFHTAGALHYPPRPFSAYILGLLRLRARCQKGDADNQSEDSDKQRDRGGEFNQEFHNFYLEAGSLKN